MLRVQRSDALVPFGRTKRDPERIGAIERNRHEPVVLLWDDTRNDIAALRAFLDNDRSRPVGDDRRASDARADDR